MSPAPDTATYFRDTAKLIRERADAATQGSHYSLDPRCYCAEWEDDERDCDHRPIRWALRIETPDEAPRLSHQIAAGIHQKGDAEHIASWGPNPARSVADWLDNQAAQLDMHLPIWRGDHYRAAVDEPPPVGWNNPAKVTETVEHHFADALNVARAYRRDVP